MGIEHGDVGEVSIRHKGDLSCLKSFGYVRRGCSSSCRGIIPSFIQDLSMCNGVPLLHNHTREISKTVWGSRRKRRRCLMRCQNISDRVEIRVVGRQFDGYNAMSSQGTSANLAGMNGSIVLLEDKPWPVAEIGDNEWEHVVRILLTGDKAFIILKKPWP